MEQAGRETILIWFLSDKQGRNKQEEEVLKDLHWIMDMTGVYILFDLLGKYQWHDVFVHN